jgi:hypothetical protein
MGLEKSSSQTNATQLPTTMPVAATCGNFVSRLQLNTYLWVSLSGKPNALFENPSLKSRKTGVINPKFKALILEGPVCVDGRIWWRIKLTNGTVGWAAEWDENGYLMEPLPK